MTDFTETPELKGVAGWLRLFVIILAVISPIRAILQTATLLQIDPAIEAQLGREWAIYEGFTWFLTAATVAATFYFAYRLIWVQNRSTVRLVIRGLWIVTVGALALDFIVAGALWPEDIAQINAEYVKGVFQSLVFATIWSLYLAKSRRVANTCVDDEHEAQRIFG
ncbi:DUF2569 family protein [Sphingopyxis sp.]|jgi:hypothetical protein|uniref:DUF2569 family protein n=1 Tax=Sphingopyxis sp. TaxID=1908224 RepID=UPI003F6ED821